MAHRYAQIYQSAYISNFILAALVLLASVVPFIFEWHVVLIVLLGLAAVFLVGLIYINTFVGNLRNWHRRWMEAREVAERLRAGLPIWLLGKRPRKQSERERTWVDWYVSAHYRVFVPALSIFNGCRRSKLSSQASLTTKPNITSKALHS